MAFEKTIRNLARKTVVEKEATVANISAEVSDPVIVHESQVFQYCTWTFSVVCERFSVSYWSLSFILVGCLWELVVVLKAFYWPV